MDLRLDVPGYRHGRTFQPFTGFRVGLIGRVGGVEATYDHPVSFGIRRSEFDDYLLQRSGARLRLGTPIQSVRRDGPLWVVNDCVKAPMLVGAGGHFCPVARLLNGTSDNAALVVAQEAEFAIDPRELSSFTTMPERPELFFSRALNGYGWCLRKQNYLNIGFGHKDCRRLPSATAEFAAFLRTEGRIPAHASCRWKGHAYLLSGPPRRRMDDGVLLVGDAAGVDGLTAEALKGIEHACIDWRWRLKACAHRLRQVHGDFHPWTILFQDEANFVVLDRSRGEWGDPADDIAALTINYLFFSLQRSERLDGNLEVLFTRFWQRYLNATHDDELHAVVGPFFAFRGLVVANPSGIRNWPKVFA